MIRTEQMGVSITGKDELSPILKHVESGIIRFVGAVSSALTTISVVAFPVKAAAQFQQALIEVRKTTDFSAESMGVLRSGVLELSKATDVAANELARIASLGGKMGLGTQGPGALLAFTEELARAVTALDVNAEVAANAMGKLVNIFDLPMTSFRNAIAVINQLANTSTASGEEIMDVMRRMGDLGGTVTYAQSAALAALAIDLGTTAETAGTTLTKIFGRMQSSADQFAAFMGVSTTEWIKLVEEDGVKALQAFLGQLNKIPAELAAQYRLTLVGGGRISTLLAKMQDQMRQGEGSRMAFLLREANDEWERGTSAVREQQNVLTGLIAQWQIFKNIASAVIIQGGDAAMVPIVRALQSIGDALKDEGVAAGFERFISRIVTSVENVIAAVSMVANALNFSAVDWTTFFDVAALLTVMKLLQYLPTIARVAALAVSSAFTAPKALGGIYAGKEGTAAVASQNAANSAANNYLKTLVQIRAQESANAAATNQTSLLRQAAFNKDAAIAQLRVGYAQRMIALEQAKAAAQEKVTATKIAIRELEQRITAALSAGNTALAQRLQLEKQRQAEAGRMARDEAVRAGRAMGGVKTQFSAQYAREVAIKKALLRNLDTQTSTYGRKAQTVWALVASSIGRARSAMASFVGVSVPANAALGVTGNLALLASAGVTALAKAMGLLRTAVNFVVAAMSKLFMVFILFNLAKMALEALGLWDKLRPVFDVLIRSANTLLGIVNKIFGTDFRVSTFAEKEEEDRAKKALKDQMDLRDEMYSRAEAFTRQFGKVEIDFTADPGEYFAVMEQMEKRLSDFTKAITEDLSFSVGASRTPAQAFLDGARTVRLMTAEMEALNQRSLDAERGMESLSRNFQNTANRIIDLERAQRDGSISEEETSELEKLIDLRDQYHKAYQRFSNTQREVTNKTRIIQEQQNSLVMDMIAALDDASYEEWFGGDDGIASGLIASLITAQQEVTNLNDALTQARQRLGSRGLSIDSAETEGKPSDKLIAEDIRKLQGELEAAKSGLDALKKGFVDTATASSLAGDQAEQFLGHILSMEDAGYLLAAIDQAARDSGQSLRDMAQGLGTVDTSVSGMTGMVGQLLYAQQSVEAYKQWGDAVRVASQQATNAIAQFAAKSRRDLEALQKMFLEIMDGLRGAAAEAELQLADKDRDSALSDELFELDLKKQKELELLEHKFEQSDMTYEAYLREKRAVEQRYAAEERALRDIADVKGATARIDFMKGDFELQRKEAEALKKQIDDITLKLKDRTLGQGVKDALGQEQQQLVSQLNARLETMKGTLQSIANTPPMAGSVLVTEDQIRPMMNALEEMQRKAASSQQEALVLQAANLNTLVQSMETGMQAATASMNTAVANLKAIAAAMDIPAEQMILAITKMAEDPRVSSSLQELKEKISVGLTDFSDIRFDDKAFLSLVGSMGDVVAQAFPDGIPFDTRINEKDLEDKAKAFAADIAAAFNVVIDFSQTEVEVIGTKKPEVGINGALEEKQLQDQLDGMNLKAGIEATINRRDGGLLSSAAIGRRADGGHIRGAGTGRSDSILSWLSHGEYVMDALTVRMFGPGFFKWLQKAAKKGVDIPRMSIPQFRDGGEVLRGAASSFKGMLDGPSVIEQYLNLSAGSTENTYLDISFNKQPVAKVRGARDQVRGLVDALQELKRNR